MAERAAHLPQFFTALAALTEGNLIPVPGGVLIQDEQQHVRGAVGISGDTGDNDEKCALAALATLKLDD
jgi:uncharacterized protein GlcG (DUF336 family)